MPRLYKKKINPRQYINYTERQISNTRVAINNGLSYKIVSVIHRVSVGTLYNKIKKLYPKKPGKPTVFSNMQELAIVQHAIAVAA